MLLILAWTAFASATWQGTAVQKVFGTPTCDPNITFPVGSTLTAAWQMTPSSTCIQSTSEATGLVQYQRADACRNSKDEEILSYFVCTNYSCDNCTDGFAILEYQSAGAYKPVVGECQEYHGFAPPDFMAGAGFENFAVQFTSIDDTVGSLAAVWPEPQGACDAANIPGGVLADSSCDIPIAGSTRVTFHNEVDGSTMIGYRVDPSDGVPSKMVIVGFPGAAELAESLSELAHEVAKQGISFIAMQYPGAYHHYLPDGSLPTFETMSETGATYFTPVVEQLRAEGAHQVIGFGLGVGDNFVRKAETRASLFDAVIVTSASHEDTQLTSNMQELENIISNTSETTEVRYAAWRELYTGSKYRTKDIAGGFERVTATCSTATDPFAVAITQPSVYTREEWTTVGGPGEENGATPLLVIGGAEDLYAPLATNGMVYKSWSPDTVTLVVVEGGGNKLQFEAPEVLAAQMAEWLQVTVSPCNSRVVGAQLSYYPVAAKYLPGNDYLCRGVEPASGAEYGSDDPGSGVGMHPSCITGTATAFRFDPPSGPSTTVVIGLPGGQELVDSFAELGEEFAKIGLSFIAMSYPGSFYNYLDTEDTHDELPIFSTMSEAAEAYYGPVVTSAKAAGATTVVGFGMALGNRFVRLAETRTDLFNAVIVASAGDTFSELTGELKALDDTVKNTSETDEVRYAAWRELYMGPKYQNVTIEGGFDRVSRKCAETYDPFIGAWYAHLPTGITYNRSVWTTIGGDKPLLVIGGTDDNFAPLEQNGMVYKSFSPDTVTLVVVEGGGHVLNYEDPALIASESKKWIESVLAAPGSYPTVVVDLVAAGTVADYDAAKQESIKEIFAADAGIEPYDVTLTITPASVLIKATLKMASEAAATNAQNSLAAKMSDATAATNFLAAAGVTVEQTPTITTTSPTPPSAPPGHTPGSHHTCSSWCNPYTCGMKSCSGCSVCSQLSAGQYCAGWCNDWTSEMYYCGGCQPSWEKKNKCYGWCNAYTCDVAPDSCSGCGTCKDLKAGRHCSSWCNRWTSWMEHCHGC